MSMEDSYFFALNSKGLANLGLKENQLVIFKLRERIIPPVPVAVSIFR